MPQDREYSEIPEELSRELRALHTPAGAFPAGRDAAILHAARSARRGGRQRMWRRAGAIGIAAAVALAAGSFWQNASHSAAPTTARTGDIRDAFLLARQIQSHQTPEARFDVNHDGRVDQEDVRALALAAVSIAPGKESAP